MDDEEYPVNIIMPSEIRDEADLLAIGMWDTINYNETNSVSSIQASEELTHAKKLRADYDEFKRTLRTCNFEEWCVKGTGLKKTVLEAGVEAQISKHIDELPSYYFPNSAPSRSKINQMELSQKLELLGEISVWKATQRQGAPNANKGQLKLRDIAIVDEVKKGLLKRLLQGNCLPIIYPVKSKVIRLGPYEHKKIITDVVKINSAIERSRLIKLTQSITGDRHMARVMRKAVRENGRVFQDLIRKIDEISDWNYAPKESADPIASIARSITRARKRNK